ncbi:MAG: glycosyl transferase family 1 [Acidimicrobiaceae bacterium]|nr:glycosyl transferase family 1 [Acidimicrobiaceae bacterium]
MTADLRVLMTMEAAWHPVPGGTGRVTVDLASALSRRSDIEVQGLSAWHRRPAPPDFSPTISVRKLKLPRPLLYEAWSRAPIPRLSVKGHDIVHSTTIVPPPASKAPLVVSVHDLAFRRFPERFPGRARRLFERSWRRVLERADAVLCPSAATSADLRAGGLAADRLHLVPLGHDPRPVTKEAGLQARQRFGIDGSFVLAAGTLEPRKNIPTLIDAFARIASATNTQLVLAGPTGWGITPQELLHPLDTDTKNRVVITGAVTIDELAALYSEATVFCYPSLLEGFGLPVLEAMSYRTPVVTSKGTSTEEVAGDAALAIDPNSVGDLADALRTVLTDHHVARELAQRGFERSTAFSWDRAASATVAVYRSLL